MTLQLENALASEVVPDAVLTRLAPLGKSAARMRSLVEQLLVLAQQESPQPAVSHTFDAMAVVIDSLGEIFPFAESKGVDLGLDVGEALELRGSEQDFLVLTRNAIDNATLYTPTGGTVDVRLYRKGDEAVSEVEDTGLGIPEGELPRVFDPFYRVVGSGQPGCGLGLAIVQRAASQLGGQVRLRTVSSDGGTGLRFTYTQALPSD